MTREEFCNTCHRTYDDPRISACSNGFHCCRDCVWLDGRITKMCAKCQAEEKLSLDISNAAQGDLDILGELDDPE